MVRVVELCVIVILLDDVAIVAGLVVPKVSAIGPVLLIVPVPPTRLVP